MIPGRFLHYAWKVLAADLLTERGTSNHGASNTTNTVRVDLPSSFLLSPTCSLLSRSVSYGGDVADCKNGTLVLNLVFS